VREGGDAVPSGIAGEIDQNIDAVGADPLRKGLVAEADNPVPTRPRSLSVTSSSRKWLA
jgi:hypothetical protein